MSALEKIEYSSKDVLFYSLLHSVQYCDLCPRMCGRKKVLSSLNGNINSKVIFIAEAPGRLGAECTGIPLLGDRTGDNFDSLLSNIGWNRNDIFITNAVLCNPQDLDGNNSTPNVDEIKRCSYYLSMTIDVVKPEIIVTLGVKALEAIKYISNHNFILNRDVGNLLNWNGKKLFPLYHMGPRALVHRNIIKQRADFIALSHIVDPIRGIKAKADNNVQRTTAPIKDRSYILSQLLDYIIHIYMSISMFKAVKLIYLIDLLYLEEFGSTFTGSTYLRMQDGPWIPELKDIACSLEKKQRIKVYFIKGKAYCDSIGEANVEFELHEKIEFINRTLKKYETQSDQEIKTIAYLTKPMRYILTEEKNNRSMLKIPVIYLNKTVIEIDKERKSQ